MRKYTLALFCLLYGVVIYAGNYIRVNQVGYLCNDIKVAVIGMDAPVSISNFILRNLDNNRTTTLKNIKNIGEFAPFAASARLDFSSVTTPGRYRIEALDAVSPEFKIGDDVYSGLNELLLYYMRQQRCGYNPFLGDSCHTHDGVIVLHPTRSGEHVDVVGGWHDASDYLQYTTTSANATYQMLFAYQEYPHVWGDNFDASGNPGANGIPDILDEARWGLEWLVKMNPDSVTFFNQIADDRDHRMSVLPHDDMVDYEFGPGGPRPVYPCSGVPYGIYSNKNESTGLASSVGKFASAFALGSRLFADIDSAFANLLKEKACNAYLVAADNPGACQTAPCVSPYYYEEDNWSDDMQLAAIEMYKSHRDNRYFNDAVDYGRLEPITPWMGADSARHYQWYPFVNLGNFLVAETAREGRHRNEFIRNMRSGLQRVAERAQGNPFLNGIPFVWCSNNLTVAFITQAMLYRQLTGDNSFLEIETAMRDWIFGANPWGKCMIIGVEGTDFPVDPHSPLSNLKQYQLTGGLVDGPVYETIFKSLRGVHLRNVDKYARFQGGVAVYHDDYSDYSTNEPTMDGTASLSFILALLASQK